MRTLEPEHRKYFNKFGVMRHASIDWTQESRKPLARCTFCVKQYGDAPKHDGLTLETVRGVNYLVCNNHRRKFYARQAQSTNP